MDEHDAALEVRTHGGLHVLTPRRKRSRGPRPPTITNDVTPDWVCEVLSPRAAASDKVQKRKLYAEHGVAHYWLVDVDARTIEAVALEGNRWVLTGSYDDQDKAAIPPFEAVELEIGRLFLPRPGV